MDQIVLTPTIPATAIPLTSSDGQSLTLYLQPVVSPVSVSLRAVTDVPLSLAPVVRGPKGEQGVPGSTVVNLYCLLDGGGTPLDVGAKGYVQVAFDCLLESVSLLAMEAGSIVIDIVRGRIEDYPPTESICGDSKPRLVGEAVYEDTVLDTWDKQLHAGDVLGFNVVSADQITLVSVSLKAVRN